MTAYFIRRLLLVPFTFLGITLMVYCILRLAPGNPIATAMAAAATVSDNSSGGSASEVKGLKPEAVSSELERFRMDKSTLEGYAGWLGIWPQETKRTALSFAEGNPKVTVPVWGLSREVEVVREGDQGELAGRPRFTDTGEVLGDDWEVRVETPESINAQWRKWTTGAKDKAAPVGTPFRAVVYQRKFSGLLQGDLGRSTKYNIPVWEMMKSRFPISLFFGLSSALLTYMVCIPLGVLKALKHGTWFDSVSSVLVFAGFAIPSYALGALLLVWLGANAGWFPLSGLTSPGHDQLSSWGKALDFAHHAFLPLLCYVISGFAMMTMLVKNSLMDQLSADYVRTAVSKGVSFRRAVVGHALQNSLIPVATSIGGILSVLVAGSYLIEKIFDINGFGLMSFQALQDTDYFILMGSLAISSLLVLLGNILSDIAVALIDPRVSYH